MVMIEDRFEWQFEKVLKEGRGTSSFLQRTNPPALHLLHREVKSNLYQCLSLLIFRDDA
jgi:hypothetical protein